MPLPQPLDYQSAIQHPSLCFEDPQLRQGSVTLGALGLPRVASGNFASVYQVTVGGTPWAVRCFHRTAGDVPARYAAIAAHLSRGRPDCLVFCDYLDRGIRVKGAWYPIVKMQWVEAPPLNLFVQANLTNRPRLDALAARWRAVCQALELRRIEHGDLQHGNILCSPATLTLVDYDGMRVPAFPAGRASELGHPAYQHPGRGPESDLLQADRFSSLVIYTALRAIAASPNLWPRFDTGDNLLFRPADLARPASSELFQALAQHADPAVARLAERLATTCAGPLNLASLEEEARKAERRPAAVPGAWWQSMTPKASPARQPEPAGGAPGERQPQGSRSGLLSWLRHGFHASPAGVGGVNGHTRSSSTGGAATSNQAAIPQRAPAAAKADVEIACLEPNVQCGGAVPVRVGVQRQGVPLAGVQATVALYDPAGNATTPIAETRGATGGDGVAMLVVRAPEEPGLAPIEVTVLIDSKVRRFTAELHVVRPPSSPIPSWLRAVLRFATAQLEAQHQPLVGNQASKRFHKPGCVWARRITRDQVDFASTAEALAAGYLPCRVCRPV